MSRTYRFTCTDNDEDVFTQVEFTTENDAWSGFDGPMYKFFDFLKGCGFCFHLDAEIGVVNGDDEFRAASDEF